MARKIFIILIAIAIVAAWSYDYKARKDKARRAEIARIQQSKKAERKITVIEGWRLKDAASYLAQEGVVSEADFTAAAKIDNWRSEFAFLKDPKIKSLEGFLYPDTYNIYADASAEDIIRKLLDEFDRKVTQKMRSDLQAQNRSLPDAVILASILEREISNKPEHDSERKIAADIFWSRLKIGMGLQSDATVNYVTGKTSTRPTYKDLEIDSPYNTYKYRGLPPGPINNPSLASLMAVIYPSPTDYLYFLTDESGKAHFGRTYAEHQRNIVKYLNN